LSIVNQLSNPDYINFLNAFFEHSGISYCPPDCKDELDDMYVDTITGSYGLYSLMHNSILDNSTLFATDGEFWYLSYYSYECNKILILQVDSEATISVIGDSFVNFIDNMSSGTLKPFKVNFIKQCRSIGLPYIKNEFNIDDTDRIIEKDILLSNYLNYQF